jgi:hypothetical protein
MQNQPLRLVHPSDAEEIVRTPADPSEDVKVPLGSSIRLRYCMGDRAQIARNPGITPGPQAFLNELPPNSSVGAHFHPIDQFQIFLPSTGAWYQRNPVNEITVHYADAYSTYGPFGSNGPGDISFYTLREVGTLDVGYMPRDRELLIRQGRRNYHRPFRRESPPAEGQTATTALIEGEDDGLAAFAVHAGPSARLTAEVIPLAPVGGEYICVLSGSLYLDEERFGVPAIGWRAPGVAWPEYQADPDEGCAIVVMQFPRPAS